VEKEFRVNLYLDKFLIRFLKSSEIDFEEKNEERTTFRETSCKESSS